MSFYARAAVRGWLVLTFSLGLSACGTPAEEEQPRACMATCAIGTVARRLPLHVYFGNGVPTAAAHDDVAAAADFYAEHQLDFQLVLEPPDTIDYALVGSREDFTQALLDADLPVNQELTPEQAQQARRVIGQVMLSALRPFLEQTAPDAEGLTLLVSREVISPPLQEFLALDGDLFGVGFPPSTLAAEQGGETEAELDSFLSAAQFERGVALVSENKLRSLEYGRANVVAHELGHALGLAHRMEMGNLMFPQVELDCRPCLDVSQAEMIAGHW